MNNEPKIVKVILNIPNARTGEDEWHDDCEIALTDELISAIRGESKFYVDKQQAELRDKELDIFREFFINGAVKFQNGNNPLMNFDIKRKFDRQKVPLNECYIFHPEDWASLRNKLTLLRSLEKEK